MSRSLVRRASVMIVIAALTLVALPPAYARPLAGPHSTTGVTTWISALSTWVSSFFFGTSPKGTGPAIHATHAADLSPTSPGTMRTMTGTCIDPNGKPVPCNPI